jgi:hypothetical protein
MPDIGLFEENEILRQDLIALERKCAEQAIEIAELVRRISEYRGLVLEGVRGENRSSTDRKETHESA